MFGSWQRLQSLITGNIFVDIYIQVYTDIEKNIYMYFLVVSHTTAAMIRTCKHECPINETQYSVFSSASSFVQEASRRPCPGYIYIYIYIYIHELYMLPLGCWFMLQALSSILHFSSRSGAPSLQLRWLAGFEEKCSIMEAVPPQISNPAARV